MADITLSYKGSTIAEVSASGTTKLNTKGKFCEDDITLQYVKPSGGGSYVGGTVAWNQMVNPTLGQASGKYGNVSVTKNGDGSFTFNGTANANSAYVVVSGFRLILTHKYYVAGYVKVGSNTGYLGFAGLQIDTGNGRIWQNEMYTSLNLRVDIRNGDVFSNVTMRPVVFDLTVMFGSTIEDYVYTLESGTAGAGIAWLKANGFFTKDYYPYDVGTLKSVETFAHPFKDSNGKIIGYFPMNFDLELRGIPKLDANNVLYYDGDEYDGNGTVTRKYGIRAYTSGDATDGSTMITDGTNTVYKLATPTTETV